MQGDSLQDLIEAFEAQLVQEGWWDDDPSHPIWPWPAVELQAAGGMTELELESFGAGRPPMLRANLKAAATAMNYELWRAWKDGQPLPGTWRDLLQQWNRHLDAPIEVRVTDDAMTIDRVVAYLDRGRFADCRQLLRSPFINFEVDRAIARMAEALDEVARFRPESVICPEVKSVVQSMNRSAGGGRAPAVDNAQVARWLEQRGFRTAENKKGLVADAAAAFGIGQTKVYEAARSAGMTSTKGRGRPRKINSG